MKRLEELDGVYKRASLQEARNLRFSVNKPAALQLIRIIRHHRQLKQGLPVPLRNVHLEPICLQKSVKCRERHLKEGIGEAYDLTGRIEGHSLDLVRLCCLRHNAHVLEIEQLAICCVTCELE